jgi:CHAT domain-containing protein
LPFEILLPATPQAGYSANNLPYLLTRFIIGYEHSATLAIEKKQRTSRPTRYSYTGFSPSYTKITIADTSADKRSVARKGSQAARPLRFNRQEIEDASRHFFRSKNFYGQAATENSFRRYATKSNVIHLSMHATVNDQNSLYSGLFFSAGDTTTQEDGFLYLYELYNIDLQADLAVLSACETGVGELTSGEGIISMGRAFQYAGCPAVAMSLWQVNDRSTHLLMKLFFENLSNGMAKDEALQHAKRVFLEDSKNKHFIHPYYWSAFILVGNETPLKVKPLFNITLFVTVAVILTVLVFLMKEKTLNFFHWVKSKRNRT